jgi:hypothetical protein
LRERDKYLDIAPAAPANPMLGGCRFICYLRA